MTTQFSVYGSRDLGVRLHQWHSGMDAVYGVGSVFYAGKPAKLEDVERALTLLRQSARGELAPASRKHIRKVISDLEDAVMSAEEEECESCKKHSGKCEREEEKNGVASGAPDAVHARARRVLLERLAVLDGVIRSSDGGNIAVVINEVKDARLSPLDIGKKHVPWARQLGKTWAESLDVAFRAYADAIGEGRKSSGKLYTKRGDVAATRYYPLRSADGTLLVAAANSFANEPEVISLGLPYGPVDAGMWFATHQAAKKALFDRLKADGDPKPGRAFGAFVVHVDPSDRKAHKSGSPSGLAHARSSAKQSAPAPSAQAHAEGALSYALGLREGPVLAQRMLARSGLRLEDADAPGVRVMVRRTLEQAAIERGRGRTAAWRDGFLRGALASVHQHGASGQADGGSGWSSQKKIGVGLVAAGVGVGVVTALVQRAAKPAPAP